MADFKSDFSDDELRMVGSNFIEPTRGQQRDMSSEILVLRATMKRLEELALSLEHNGLPAVRAAGAELRKQMKGTP